jgi:hypothetical protein
VTFLFTDVEGSTRRWERDADSMRAALAVHDDVLRSAVESRGGWLFKHTGDGVCAAFSSAMAAIDAAVDAQRRLPLPVRMGLGSGEAEPLQSRNRFLVNVIMQALAGLESRHGEPQNALQLFEDMLDILYRAGDQAILTTSYGYLCVLFDRLEEPETAVTLYGAGGERLRSVTYIAGLPEALQHLQELLGDGRYQHCVRGHGRGRSLRTRRDSTGATHPCQKRNSRRAAVTSQSTPRERPS